MINFLKNFFNKYFYDDEQYAALFILSIGIVILYFLGGIIAPVLVSILIAYILNGLMSFMEDFAKVIKISPELRSFIQSKKVKNLEKSKLLNQSFKDKSNSIFIEYINTIDIDFNLKLFSWYLCSSSLLIN